MNRAPQFEREKQLRKVAILIASLDDALAERMLTEMPAADAQAVRHVVESLEEVDPEEEREIVEEFQLSTRTAVTHDTEGVELDASLLARIEQQDFTDCQDPVEGRRSPLTELTDDEAATIVDTLSREHPQTVAVVISRLDQAAAAKILCLLSPNLQVEVLERVAELDPADQQSLQVVESHLEQWINQQRQRKERMAAGAELAHRILRGTSQADRTAILTRLDGRNPQLAARFGQNTEISESAMESQSLPSSTRVRKTFRSTASYRSAAKAVTPPKANQVPELHATMSSDPLAELERLDDAALMEAITLSDRQVVTLALAGASDALMNRIVRRLPRRQAKEFRKRLRDIGPTRLSDMLSAQHELALKARQLT